MKHDKKGFVLQQTKVARNSHVANMTPEHEHMGASLKRQKQYCSITEAVTNTGKSVSDCSRQRSCSVDSFVVLYNVQFCPRDSQ